MGNGYDSGWLAELAYWRSVGMADKLAVGFCPTCWTSGEPSLAEKFAAAATFKEIDFFAYAASDEQYFEPYWAGMKAWLRQPQQMNDSLESRDVPIWSERSLW